MLQVLTFFCVVGVITGSNVSPVMSRRDVTEEHLFNRPIRFRGKQEDAIPVKQYRLTGNVVPSAYTLRIDLAENSLSDTDAFEGTVTIGLIVESDTNVIDLNARYLNIVDFKVESDGTNIADSIEYNPESDAGILKINTTETLTTDGVYTLTISFTGMLSETAMAGFYKSTYKEQDQDEYLATTQFESTSARRAFPCFDEPEMKATFDLTIGYFGEGFNAISNTAGVTTTIDEDAKQYETVFNTTPKMSTYLLAFIVSKFECFTGDSIDDDSVPTDICSRPNTEDYIDLAKETGPKALEVMEGYTGFKYGDSGIGKMTQVAIPDFAAGAMENWGLVTYREADVLWSPDESSTAYQQRVVTVVAHEFAHQWFGDLVTLDWWKDVFLNEGFATYFEYHSPAEFYPEWDLTKQFAVQEVQTALLYDSVTTSLALSSDVETPTEISNRFDSISYNKGGSIIRMVQHFLGSLDSFKGGLAAYIKDKKFDNGDPSTLWSSFNTYGEAIKNPELPAKVDEIMENWTNKPGHPMLHLIAGDNGDITITQERFLLTGPEAEPVTTWYVPISYTLSTDDNFEDTAPKAWLTPDDPLVLSKILTDDVDWIVLNNQQTGFFRVHYDDTLFGKITAALSDDIANIDELSRAQITDDLLTFARADKITFNEALEKLKFLVNETSYYTWYSAFNGFNYLNKRLGDQTVKKALAGYLTEAIASFDKATPFNTPQDNVIYTYAKTLAKTWACSLGVEDCVNNSLALFASFRDDGTKVDPNLRSVVYCNGLKYSADPKTDFDFLWTKLEGSVISTETVTILNSLGCTTDEDLLKEYLTRTIADDSIIRVQDVTYPFASVYSSNAVGVDVALDFVIANVAQITKYYGDDSLVSSLLSSISDRITAQSQIDKLSGFTTDLPDNIKDDVNDLIASSKDNLKTIASLEAQMKEYFQLAGTTTTAAPTTDSSTVAETSVVLICTLICAFALL